MQLPWQKQSYIQKKKTTRAKKRPPREVRLLRRQIFIGISLFIVIGLLLTAVWYGTRIDGMQITSVDVTGGRTISHELLEKKANEVLQGEYFRLVPRTFSWWYPKQEIITTLAAVPRVKEVRVVSHDKQTLQIAFTEYEPVALWCDQTEVTNCVFIDNVGYAFAGAPELTGNALVRYFTDTTPAVKQVAVENELLSITSSMVDRLETELHLFVTAIEIDDIDIAYHLTGGGEIKTTTRMSVGESLANLASILVSADFAHIADGDFHYIDLRFGDKVFVSEEEPAATTTDEVVADTNASTE